MLDFPTQPVKAHLLSAAIKRYRLKSLVDVGGCWGVNGGYSFHALSEGAEQIIIADGEITALTRTRAAGDSRIELRQGMLGDSAFVASLPRCDAAILFDVLLHQVAPDWNEFLALYAERVDHFVIYNQDWIGADSSVRFVDQGLEWYVENVGNHGAQDLSGWFAKHETMCAEQGKLWRDVHNYWQWGIVSVDLIVAMRNLGFSLDFFENYGAWSERHPCIEVHGYLFARRSLPAHASA